MDDADFFISKPNTQVKHKEQGKQHEDKYEEVRRRYYLPPRQGVDDKIIAYFEAKKMGLDQRWDGFRDSMPTYPSKRILCDFCAGNHLTEKCMSPATYLKMKRVCHLCGAEGHIKGACPRRRCYVCLEIGHSPREKHDLKELTIKGNDMKY